jgi:hypothetical protein
MSKWLASATPLSYKFSVFHTKYIGAVAYGCHPLMHPLVGWSSRRNESEPIGISSFKFLYLPIGVISRMKGVDGPSIVL